MLGYKPYLVFMDYQRVGWKFTLIYLTVKYV